MSKSHTKNNKLKTAPMSHGKFKLSNGPYSVSDIQYHFEYII